MNPYWSDHVASLIPYVPGEQANHPDLLKLNTNEHPWGPSPKALQAIRDAANDRLRLYPDPQATDLCEAIAHRLGLHAGQVFVGNGSDEVLGHVFNALFRRGGLPLLLPDITYSFYRTYCKLFDIPARLVPLSSTLTIDPKDYAPDQQGPVAGVIFANPNAPTGHALPLSDIEAILQSRPDVPVVVDEAYVDFGAESAVALLAKHPNLVVVHTLSKSWALAGLRVGYALASPDMVDGLRRVKDSFNSYPLDRLTQAGAAAAIRDTDYFQRRCAQVQDARKQLVSGLTDLGFEVLPSATNFVFARHPAHDAATLAADLRAQGILVRHFAQPRIAQYLRISVGTPSQCDRLCSALAGLVSV